jgi:PEP-CTERM motif
MKYMKSMSGLVALWICAAGSVSAQVVSLNVVGYVNLVYSANDYLIGNPLYAGTNDLNHLFSYNIPDGSSIAKWDRTTHQFLAPSIYHEGTGWTINYDLSPSEGALFHPTATFTNTFTGQVPWSGDSPLILPPTLGDGLFLLSCTVPFNGATFYQVIGRAPMDGDSVTRLDPFSMTYTTTIFQSGEWNNGDPTLNVGEAAFFGLGRNTILPPSLDSLPPVPEPGIYALLSLGLAGFALQRRFRRKSNALDA